MKLTSLTAASAFALAAIATTGAPPASATSRPSCTFTFHTGTVYTQHNAVIGGGYAECASTPAGFSINLTVRFKPRGSNTWASRGAESSIQIPAPRLNIAAWADCQEGAWKGVATIWETAPDGTTTQTDFPSAPRIVTC
ncbi:hypothetical protein [Nocardia thailandica]|uniref:hypothetical protein n=1 Tax=Nocardia thailandica TaxID=257275 RepID=UPI0002D8EE8B|nr:hypothetical protein [Nocardia thailandica]